MKPLDEQLTARTRPRLVLSRLSERILRLRSKLAERSKTIQALNGKVRDLEVSRAFWRTQAESVASLASTKIVENASQEATKLPAIQKKVQA